MHKALILIAGLAALAASPSAAERRVTKSARLAPGESSEVTIVSPCGSVSVRAAPGDEVRVDATITADGSLTVHDSGAVTVGGSVFATSIHSHGPSSISTGSDLTRISLMSTTGTISIEPWEEARP